MIGVDWGTTHARAFLLRKGEVVARREGPGIMEVGAGGFAEALQGMAGAWLAGEDRVLLSGMVGSRQGWVEAAYLPCPADLAGLAGAAVAVEFAGARVRVLPGLSCVGGVPEVMRGEEVQIAGVLGRTGADAVICLPGTHSKWARVEGGVVAGFRTHLTGEAFAALRGHTILGRLMAADGAVDGVGETFLRGVDRAGEAGGVLHHLFGVRTLGLFGALPEREAASYLSGLLIGHEVRAEASGEVVHLVGSAGLCGLYAAAIGRVGGRAEVVAGEAAAMGLAAIGEQVRWD